VADNPPFAFVVPFQYGAVYGYYQAYGLHVRCVR
jgi:hypothetical protein